MPDRDCAPNLLRELIAVLSAADKNKDNMYIVPQLALPRRARFGIRGLVLSYPNIQRRICLRAAIRGEADFCCWNWNNLLIIDPIGNDMNTGPARRLQARSALPSTVPTTTLADGRPQGSIA